MISAAEFEAQGKGSFGFDHTVDFRALLLLSQKLTQEIEGRANEAKISPIRKVGWSFRSFCLGKLPGAKPKPISAMLLKRWDGRGRAWIGRRLPEKI